MISQLLLRNHPQRIVDALQALQVDLETVKKDAPHDVAADLSQGRVTVHLYAFGLGIDGFAHANHEHPIRAEMQRRTDRRKLPHRSVAKIFTVEPHGRKEERDSGRCKEMRRSLCVPRCRCVDAVFQGEMLSTP